MYEDLLYEEEKKMRRLRLIVDLTEAALLQPTLSLQASLRLMENTKKTVLTLFPDKEGVYDLLYTSRFRRIIDERFTIAGTRSGRN